MPGNLLNAPRVCVCVCVYIYIYIYMHKHFKKCLNVNTEKKEVLWI